VKLKDKLSQALKEAHLHSKESVCALAAQQVIISKV